MILGFLTPMVQVIAAWIEAVRVLERLSTDEWSREQTREASVEIVHGPSIRDIKCFWIGLDLLSGSGVATVLRIVSILLLLHGKDNRDLLQKL